MKIFFATAILLLSCLVSFSQFPGMRAGAGQNMNMGQFYGKVMDSTSGKALEGASVQLIQNKLDSASKKKKDFIIATILTNKKGEFSIEGLAVMSNYRIVISAIGYKKYEKKTAFEMNMNSAKSGDFSSMLSGVSKDLGNILLIQDSKQLENVTVTSSKPLFQLYADKKVYNVERDLTATGGTAVDAIKNVPSVNVDMDGNVTMRNSSPQIFVDGRPTTLSLDQIPADQISSVEVISNPSAKYDASGGGGGILNIVLKKNRKTGYNGNLRSSIDSRGRPGLGGDFNFRQNKLNFSLSGYSGLRKTIVTGSSNREDYLPDGKTAFFNQTNNPIGKGGFGYLRTSMDYFIDNRNTITINGSIGRGYFKNRDKAILNYDTSGSNSSYGATRETYSDANFRNYGTGLSFKHNFAKTGKEWTVDANLNYNENRNTTDFDMIFGSNGSGMPDTYQRAQGGGNTRFYTFQTDFVNPLTATTKMEMGARMAIRNFYNSADNYFKAPTGNYVFIPGFGTSYSFEDQVLAGYVIYSRQLKKMNYQAGLRAEYFNYDGLLINEGQTFKTKYPISLFPSLNMTFKLNDKQDLQFNYSRKVNRPGFFQLMPFVDSTDFLNVSVGNPELQPEFTNIIEIVFSKQYGSGQSFIGTLYGKITENLITRYQYWNDDFNPVKDSVLVTTFGNASNSYTVGLELTGKNKITKWWDLTSNLNFFNINLQAGNLPGTVSSNQFSYFIKLNNNFKLPKNFSIQLTADYQAKTLLPASGGRSFMGGGGMFFGGGGFGQNQPTAQGYIRPIFGMDIAIKMEFLKNNAASLTLQCSDIFASREFSTHSESSFFSQDNFRLRDPQLFRLNFNWRFGKLDVSLFKRKNLKGEMENMQNMQNMMGP